MTSNPGNLGEARGSIRIDAGGVRAGMAEAERHAQNGFARLAGVFSGNLQQLGQNMQLVGRNITLMTAPISAFIAQGVFAFANFDEALTEIQARTGATAGEMELVRTTAMQMGRDTQFSATQAAQGMLELLASGSTLEEAIATLPHVLNLAAAGALDLGYASDAVTDILAQFQLGVEDAEGTVQALNAASQSSSATIPDLIDAFGNVGPIAANFGLNVDETAAILAVFAENGIKGAEAGTQLKSMLTNMSSDRAQQAFAELGVSMFDAEGNMRNFEDIIDDLNVAMEGMSDQERIAFIQDLGGAYGQMGLSALLASDGIDEMQEKMANSASVSDVAAARMQSFKGRVNQLKSSLETLSITVIGPLVEEYLEPLISKVTVILNQLTEWIEQNEGLASQIGIVLAVMAGMGPVIMGIGFAITVLASPIGLIALAIVLLVGALGALWIAYEQNFMGIGDTIDGVVESILPALQSIIDWFNALVAAFQERDWGEVGRLVAQGIMRAILAILQFRVAVTVWIWNNLIRPIIDYLAGLDWGTVLTEVGNFLGGLLEGLAQGTLDLATWVLDNIITPLVDEIAATDWGQALINAGNVLADIFEALAGLAVDAGRWVWENVIVPIRDELRDTPWAAVLLTVGNILLKIFEALAGFTVDVATWVFENIIQPIGEAIGGVDWTQAADNLTAFGEGLFDALAGAVDFASEAASWVNDNILGPIGNAIGDAAGAIGDLVGLGGDSGGGSGGDWSVFNMATSGDIEGLRAIQGQPGQANLINAEDQIAELERLKGWFDQNGEGISGALMAMHEAGQKVVLLLSTIWEQAQGGVKNLEKGVVDSFTLAKDAILNSTNELNGLTGLLLQFWPLTKPAVERFGTEFADVLDPAREAVLMLSDAMNGLLERLGQLEGRQIALAVAGSIPGRASGGPVAAMAPYMVGERGPELFVPQTNGQIVPNAQLGGDKYEVVFNVYGGLDEGRARGFADQFVDYVRSRGG